MILLFNGNLLLLKRKIQFENWIKAYNFIYKTNILFIDSNIIFLLTNSWLCGFTDAKGCFTASIVKRSETYTQVFVRYILAQQNEEVFFNLLCICLKGNLYYLKSYNGYNLVVNLSKLDIIINYFKNYKLKTKKYISFKIWLKIYLLVKKKLHFTEKGLVRIQYLKERLNLNNY